ncbi:hypothetical protein FGLOB1_2404 [Fusarium globosum]|uniref:Uncharacterized protein n=1 Tax=Fusarium globosum TaxID=78864 RepID=A0A8H5YQ51_9HYPO|nr:hypothetical protein FGLOB1_2404 [Fusarium globosum]
MGIARFSVLTTRRVILRSILKCLPSTTEHDALFYSANKPEERQAPRPLLSARRVAPSCGRSESEFFSFGGQSTHDPLLHAPIDTKLPIHRRAPSRIFDAYAGRLSLLLPAQHRVSAEYDEREPEPPVTTPQVDANLATCFAHQRKEAISHRLRSFTLGRAPASTGLEGQLITIDAKEPRTVTFHTCNYVWRPTLAMIVTAT